MECEVKHQIGYIYNGGIRIQTPCFIIHDENNALKIDGSGSVIIRIPDYWTEEQKQFPIFTPVYTEKDGKIFPKQRNYQGLP